MLCGVSDAVIVQLQDVFARHVQVKRVVLFGSRARGDNKHSSDIDIAVFSDSGVSGELYADIDEAVGIYKVDIIDMANVNNDKLIRNIDKEGVEIYRRR